MSMRAADDNTEILLTEYLDGTLPPGKRAEIDAYLAAHPRERAVLEELVSQRAALGGSPRERAPADVLDAVQSRLERSTLLDGLEDIRHLGDTGRSRLRFRPTVLATAAMLLVSAGLATMVYLMVRKAPTGDDTIALSGPPARHEVAPVAVTPSAGAPSTDGPVAMSVGAAPRSRSADAPTAKTDGVAPGMDAVTPPPAGGGPASAFGSIAPGPAEGPADRSAERAREGTAGRSPADLLPGHTPPDHTAPSHTAPGPTAPGPTAPGHVAPGSVAAAPRASLEVRPNAAVTAPDPAAALPPANVALEVPADARRVVLVVSDVVRTRAEVESFLSTGGWGFARVPDNALNDRGQAPVSTQTRAQMDNVVTPQAEGQAVEAPPTVRQAVAVERIVVRVEADQVDMLASAIAQLARPGTPGAATRGSSQMDTREASATRPATRPAGDAPAIAPGTPATVGDALQTARVPLVVEIRTDNSSNPPEIASGGSGNPATRTAAEVPPPSTAPSTLPAARPPTGN